VTSAPNEFARDVEKAIGAFSSVEGYVNEG
jgi:hypothetical protein